MGQKPAACEPARRAMTFALIAASESLRAMRRTCPKPAATVATLTKNG
jgi:hypothetical protein